MNTVTEIQKWADTHPNHPKYPDVMLELQLIAALQAQKHGHSTMDDMRRFWNYASPASRIYIIQVVGKALYQKDPESSSVQVFDVMKDPGDEFFKLQVEIMRNGIRDHGKQFEFAQGFTLRNDEIMCDFDLEIQDKIDLGIEQINKLLNV